MVTHGPGRNRAKRIHRTTPAHALNRSFENGQVSKPRILWIAVAIAMVATIALVAVSPGGDGATADVVVTVLPKAMAAVFILIGASAVAFALAFALGGVDLTNRPDSQSPPD